MNPADAAVGALLLVGARQGFRHGFVASLYGLAALGAELIVASWLKVPLGALVAPFVPLPEALIEPAAFLVVLGAAGLVLGLAGAVVVRLARLVLYRIPFVRAADRVLGIVPGVAQYALIAASLVVLVGLFAPATSPLGQQIRSSALTPLVDYVGGLVSERFDLGAPVTPSPQGR